MAASVSLDLELPDEGVDLGSLTFSGDAGVQSADAVTAAALSAAECQRVLRIDLLARHGLSMTGHVLHEVDPLPTALLAALRIAMLTGDELSSLAEADPLAGPLSDSSERKMCETLRAVLNGLAGSVDDDGSMRVLRTAYEALDTIEGRLPRRTPR